MKKKIFELGALGAAIIILSGCQGIDSLGNAVYEPVVETKVIETSEGPVSIVSTNGWVLKSNIRQGIEIAGDVAPFPWSNLAATTTIALLGIGAHIRGRQWKKAAVSGVSAAQAFKKELKEIDAARAAKVKSGVVAEQRTSGTQAMVQKILSYI
jgi:hypothetical protein